MIKQTFSLLDEPHDTEHITKLLKCLFLAPLQRFCRAVYLRCLAQSINPRLFTTLWNNIVSSELHLQYHTRVFWYWKQLYRGIDCMFLYSGIMLQWNLDEYWPQKHVQPLQNSETDLTTCAIHQCQNFQFFAYPAQTTIGFLSIIRFILHQELFLFYA